MELPKYILTLSVSPSGAGTVSGGGDYYYGDTAYISASANENYKFTKWSDDNTNASRSFTITDDVSLTAYFEYIGVVVNISSGQGGSATVRNTRTGQSGTSVSGIVGDTFVFSGTPNIGYSKAYVQLSGSSNQIAYGSNYTIDASGTYNFTGYFTPNQYTISVSKGSGEFDSYHSGGTYSYGTNVELWVNVNPHYNFLYWEDSNGNRISPTSSSGNSYKVTVQVLGNKAYTIHASPRVYTISVSANPADGGTVSGGGEYTAGTEVTISAKANEGYAFSSWSDGVTSASRKITLNSDVTLTANFDKVVYTCTYYKGSSTGGTVPAPQTYHYDDYVTIRDKGSLTHDDVISSSSYTISFNANGGSTTKTSESCSITKTSKYSFSG